jgi:DNA-directed RNA polymerase subunit RPC12/RpoP
MYYACPDCENKLIELSNKTFESVSEYSKVTCKICGYTGKEIVRHIKEWHSIPIDEYKLKYNSTVKSEELSDNYRGSKNPAYQHGGKLSPWSKKSEYHDHGFVDECKNAAIAKSMKNPKHGTNTIRLQTYIDMGMSQEEAKAALYDRQNNFTLEKCIVRHGEEGRRIYQDRQDRWQATMNNKSIEEKTEINRKKMSKGFSISKAERDISNILSEHFDIISQFTIISHDKSYIYDISYNNKIIEYNGDFWHMNPRLYTYNDINRRTKLTAKETWEKDRKKIDIAIDSGFDILVIWESDYKKDKQGTIDKCINFLIQ